MAKQKFGGDFQHSYNSNQTFVLCFAKQRTGPKSPFPGLPYFVYDLKAREIIYEDQVIGQVGWLNRDQLSISRIPETVRLEDDGVMEYIYDVRLRKKIVAGKHRI